jgi:hypothetical protein
MRPYRFGRAAKQPEPPEIALAKNGRALARYCLAKGCGRMIRPDRDMCRGCWDKVPGWLRSLIGQVRCELLAGEAGATQEALDELLRRAIDEVARAEGRVAI